MAGHEGIGGFDLTIKVAEDQDYVRRLARVGRYGFLRRPNDRDRLPQIRSGR